MLVLNLLGTEGLQWIPGEQKQKQAHKVMDWPKISWDTEQRDASSTS